MAWTAKITSVRTLSDRLDVSYDILDGDGDLVESHTQGFPMVASTEEYEGDAVEFDPESGEPRTVTTTYRRETGGLEWTPAETVREAICNYVRALEGRPPAPVAAGEAVGG